jgi:hypothetical protein
MVKSSLIRSLLLKLIFVLCISKTEQFDRVVCETVLIKICLKNFDYRFMLWVVLGRKRLCYKF